MYVLYNHFYLHLQHDSSKLRGCGRCVDDPKVFHQK